MFMKKFGNTGSKEHRDLRGVPFGVTVDFGTDDFSVGRVRLKQFGLKKGMG